MEEIHNISAVGSHKNIVNLIGACTDLDGESDYYSFIQFPHGLLIFNVMDSSCNSRKVFLEDCKRFNYVYMLLVFIYIYIHTAQSVLLSSALCKLAIKRVPACK